MPASVPSRKVRSPRRAVKQRGLTLIETALIIALLGVLLAAFVPTFLRHLRTSKIAEATERLASLHQHAVAYYAHRHPAGVGCLPEPAGPFPERPSAEPVEVDFASDARGAATWRALGEDTPRSLRYSYEVAVPTPGCQERPFATAAITLRAHGDLDADGEPSLLERAAAPSRNGSALVPLGPLRIVARTE